MSADRRVDVSVCIPTYNEQTALRKTVVELIDAMTPLPYAYEIIVIDDGSTDDSLKQIADLPVRIIRPSAVTTVNPSTFSRIVPYRTAVVPEARVAVMPPMVASAPGSIGNINPVLRSALAS